MVTMVYQNDAGMEVNVESDSLWGTNNVAN